ncbi:hypothetical protein ACIQM4_25815 [Streptomyces sp. NPDC091272]|uniref:hypothetical protein n=1 Tax=Streptomyces sp. NPDC091272 TaxID=3365981 RepID=UPI00382679B7
MGVAVVRGRAGHGSAQTPYPDLSALLSHLTRDGITAEVLSVRGQSDGRDHQCLRLTRPAAGTPHSSRPLPQGPNG